MPTIQQLWEIAQLSQASYYNLPQKTDEAVNAAIKVEYDIYQFSATQADRLIGGPTVRKNGVRLD